MYMLIRFRFLHGPGKIRSRSFFMDVKNKRIEKRIPLTRRITTLNSFKLIDNKRINLQ